MTFMSLCISSFIQQDYSDTFISFLNLKRFQPDLTVFAVCPLALVFDFPIPFKGTAQPKLKIQSSSTHPNVDRKSGEVS